VVRKASADEDRDRKKKPGSRVDPTAAPEKSGCGCVIS
jgi:hypothetical protein